MSEKEASSTEIISREHNKGHVLFSRTLSKFSLIGQDLTEQVTILHSRRVIKIETLGRPTKQGREGRRWDHLRRRGEKVGLRWRRRSGIRLRWRRTWKNSDGVCCGRENNGETKEMEPYNGPDLRKSISPPLPNWTETERNIYLSLPFSFFCLFFQ